MTPLVKEEQRMTPYWIFVVLLSACFVVLYAVVNDLFFDPTESIDTPKVLALLSLSAIPLLCVWYFYKNKLYTTYDQTGIRVTYFPFVYTFIQWSEIEQMEWVKKECEDFSIAYSKERGRIYQANGNAALKIHTKQSVYTIGTAQPELVGKLVEEIRAEKQSGERKRY